MTWEIRDYTDIVHYVTMFIYGSKSITGIKSITEFITGVVVSIC